MAVVQVELLHAAVRGTLSRRRFQNVVNAHDHLGALVAGNDHLALHLVRLRHLLVGHASHAT